jgi:hypothetical protein
LTGRPGALARYTGAVLTGRLGALARYTGAVLTGRPGAVVGLASTVDTGHLLPRTARTGPEFDPALGGTGVSDGMGKI